MTNGEKFKEIFQISQVDEGELYAYVWLPNHDAAEISIGWWNAEYKESTTKNDLGVDAVSRQALIDWLKNWTLGDASPLIDYVNSMPSVTPQFSSGLEKNSKKLEKDCESDSISRAALIERINNAEEQFKYDHMETIGSDDGDPFVDGVLSGVWNIREMVKQAPSVTPPQPKTGHWIMSDDGLYRPICDKCGAHPWKGYIPTVEEATEVFNYCPNCGAKMVEPQESEDKE